MQGEGWSRPGSQASAVAGHEAAAFGQRGTGILDREGGLPGDYAAAQLAQDIQLLQAEP